MCREKTRTATAMVLCICMLCLIGPAQAEGDSPLGAGDLVFIEVQRHPELSVTTQVDDNGNVSLPYIGNVSLTGLSQADAAARVTQAYGAILKNPRVSVSRSGEVSYGGGERTAEMKTQLVHLQNSNAQVVYEALAGMVTAGGSLGFDPDTNTLIVTDTPSTIQNIMSVVMQLDQMQTQLTQVHIESKIADVEAGKLKELGVRWFAQGDHLGGGYTPNARMDTRVDSARQPTDVLFNEILDSGTGNNRGGGRRFIDESNFDRRLQIPIQTGGPGQIALGYFNHGIDLGVMLDALVADNDAELLATPYIRTVNHKTAEIRMVEEFPYQEVGSVGLGTQTTTRFLDIGIIMQVTPHVRHDNAGGVYVQLELEPEVSMATGIANGVPVRSVRSSSSVANVRNGQTLVIGGIIQSDVRDVVQKVPALGSLPILGTLFRHKEKSQSKRELMIFVTPTVYETPESVSWDRTINLTEAVHGVGMVPPAQPSGEERKD